MNRQIRLLGAGLMALFLALFVQLNYLQVVHAPALETNPLNGESVVKEYSAPRGDIISADGVTLAESVPTNDQFKYLREYPTGSLFEEVTGYFSFNYGADGAEKTYDAILTGKKSPFKLPTSIAGIRNYFTATNSAQSITLTVLDKLQTVAQAGLAGRQGSVVAIDPSTGAILAMYSNPSFNPNELSTHNLTQAAANYKAISSVPGALDAPAYRQTWFPGSAFKVITASAVYDHDPSLAVTPQPYLSALRLPDSSALLHNFAGENCGGPILQLFTVSCDTGFGQIGLDLGAQNLYDESTAFGFDAVPPIDLPYAVASYFPPVSEFAQNVPTLAYSAIGQEDDQATPLEMAMVAGAIADKGVIMTPHILGHVTNSLGQTVESYTPTPWRTATSPQTAAAVTKLMESVVSAPDGTGVAAAIPGITVAGKTGTAQTGTRMTDDWFVAFAPAQDPKIAVAAMLPDQGNAIDDQGGTLAAPIVKSIIEAYLSSPGGSSRAGGTGG